MSFELSYDGTEQLYNEFLKELKNIKFTLREIDVIACILHNRGEKKIASLLSISPKTVSAHVHNIMNKLGCNSKDQIIDFIETTDKIALFRKYYVHIVARANFEKFLINVARKANSQKQTYACSRDEVLELDNTLFSNITKHCSLANCELLQYAKENLNKLPNFNLQKITKANYYQNLVDYISELVSTPGNQETLKQLKKDFSQGLELAKDANQSSTIIITKNQEHRQAKRKKYIGYAIIAVFIIVVLLQTLQLLPNNLTSKLLQPKQGPEQQVPETIESLEQLLQTLNSEQFSADNAHQEQASKNHNIIKKVEKILDYTNREEVNNYFVNSSSSSEYLTNYIYNLHALASYYMYNQRDGFKSNKILLQAKTLMENYVNSRCAVASNFEKLDSNEILSELKIIKDFPELYTRILYSLGRTHIYMGTHEQGAKYFNISKYLGKKLGLFEGYLSDISGLLVLENKKAAQNIKEGKDVAAIQILEKTVEKYKKLRNDSNIYIKDFKPGQKQQTNFKASTSEYNNLECSNRIIFSYNELIKANTNQEQKSAYLKSIAEHLQLPNNQNPISLLRKVTPRKTAAFYNNLGQTYFLMHKLSLNNDVMNKLAQQKLGVKSNNTLDIAKELYLNAKNISRNTDFTKADAYDGLINVYKEQIIQINDGISNNKESHKSDLIRQIQEFTEKRDNINHQLGHKQ